MRIRGRPSLALALPALERNATVRTGMVWTPYESRHLQFVVADARKMKKGGLGGRDEHAFFSRRRHDGLYSAGYAWEVR